jgi:hypothetical protein
MNSCLGPLLFGFNGRIGVPAFLRGTPESNQFGPDPLVAQ